MNSYLHKNSPTFINLKMNKLVFILAIFLVFTGCNQPLPKETTTKSATGFSFVFMTDVHVTTDRHADKGLMQAR